MIALGPFPRSVEKRPIKANAISKGGLVMLVTRQLAKRIFNDVQRLKKESQELHHACRNMRSVSLLLRTMIEQQRKATSDQTIRPRALHRTLQSGRSSKAL